MRTVVDRLADGAIAVVPEILDETIIEALRAQARSLDSSGRLANAATGRGHRRALRESIRGDRIAWLEPETANPAECAYLDTMEALRQTLNRALMLGLAELEVHYALYPAGAAYARHRDRFHDDDARVVSCILYLNDDWHAEHGGALRVQVEDDRAIDIQPAGGTFVAFMADGFEHEVLPSTRPRVALTGWFRRRA